jgi:hypothetical protein
MQAFLAAVFEWFRDADNRGAVQVIAAVAVVLVAWATGLLRWLFGLLRAKPAPPANDSRPSQTASGGGVNVGGDVKGDVTTRSDGRR